MTNQSIPEIFVPRMPPLPVIKHDSERAFESLVQQIKQFEHLTTDEEVVGAMLASFGQSVTIQIQQIRRSGQMICMEGVTESGDPATLIQHFTQASILLVKLPKVPAVVKRPIGFVS